LAQFPSAKLHRQKRRDDKNIARDQRRYDR